MIEKNELNLARTWRSQTFDEVVGQPLPIRMLKNSLYRGRYFPVYLFSGQRGCGKTSSARIFAAAVSCALLDKFRDDPRSVMLPCRVCESCQAMAEGRHPDFIEIDAASHTGVDHVRSLIEASSLMPVMGRKKIYLIDEAHMLSKAAFNALLKVLEEPPESALFILATTDIHKVIDTVRSRCFQLFFKPIPSQDLCDHLVRVCSQEAISYTAEGIQEVVRHVQGSARDALNLLEQVRFACGAVTQEAVIRVLGHLDDARVVALLEAAMVQGPHKLLAQVKEIDLEIYNARAIWTRMQECIRAALWLKYGVQPRIFVGDTARVHDFAQRVSHRQLVDALALFCSYEQAFIRTTEKHSLIEMVLLSLSASGSDLHDASGGSSPAAQASPGVVQEEAEIDEEGFEDEQEEDEEEDAVDGDPWQIFLRHVELLNDPLLISIFSQASSVVCSREEGTLKMKLPTDFRLFSDKLDDVRLQLEPLLVRAYGVALYLDPQFVDVRSVETSAQSTSKSVGVQSVSEQPRQQKNSVVSAMPVGRPGAQLDVSDLQNWPIANRILKHFPGTVSETNR